MQDPTSDVHAAADLLIQAASRASPSVSPPPTSHRTAFYSKKEDEDENEDANIGRLLRAAAEIKTDRDQQPFASGKSAGAFGGRRRSVSPLFVPRQTGPQARWGLYAMAPEPCTPEDTGGELSEEGEVRGSAISEQFEPHDGESSVMIPVADERNVVAEEAREVDATQPSWRERGHQFTTVTRTPVAKRLRELYRRAVLVKDRKGRMRRLGGGAVVKNARM